MFTTLQNVLKSKDVLEFQKNSSDLKNVYRFKKWSWLQQIFLNFVKKMFVNAKHVDQFKNVHEFKKCLRIQNKIMNLKKGKWNQKMFMTFKKLLNNSKNIPEGQKIFMNLKNVH